MKRVFADTAYWFALLNPRDEFHSRALEASAQLEGLRIVTSDWVLTELLNGSQTADRKCGRQLRLQQLLSAQIRASPSSRRHGRPLQRLLTFIAKDQTKAGV